MRAQFEATDIEGVWRAEANLAGPTVAIFGGVHGDELTGIEVVKQTVEKGLDIEAGSVFLALGNLAAIAVNRRHTGTNLNRVFRDLTQEEAELFDKLPYEMRRAQELNRVLDNSDALLDLHDFSDPKGPVFMITEELGFPVACMIGAPVISSGWSVTEFGGSDSRMASQQKVGICYELGDKTQPIANLTRGMGARDRFLEQQDHHHASRCRDKPYPLPCPPFIRMPLRLTFRRPERLTFSLIGPDPSCGAQPWHKGCLPGSSPWLVLSLSWQACWAGWVAQSKVAPT